MLPSIVLFSLPSLNFGIPTWVGGIVLALVIGLIIGSLVRHHVKFGIILVVAVAILLTFGMVSESSLLLVFAFAQPEALVIWNFAQTLFAYFGTTVYIDAIFVAIGLLIGLWKL